MRAQVQILSTRFDRGQFRCGLETRNMFSGNELKKQHEDVSLFGHFLTLDFPSCVGVSDRRVQAQAGDASSGSGGASSPAAGGGSSEMEAGGSAACAGAVAVTSPGSSA